MTGRRVLVVGGGQMEIGEADTPIGNGRAMSILVAREGASVAVADRIGESAAATVAAVEGAVVEADPAAAPGGLAEAVEDVRIHALLLLAAERAVLEPFAARQTAAAPWAGRWWAADRCSRPTRPPTPAWNTSWWARRRNWRRPSPRTPKPIFNWNPASSVSSCGCSASALPSRASRPSAGA